MSAVNIRNTYKTVYERYIKQIIGKCHCPSRQFPYASQYETYSYCDEIRRPKPNQAFSKQTVPPEDSI